MGTRVKHLTNYIFSKRLNSPSFISPPLLLESWKTIYTFETSLTESNTLPPNNLQKFSLKKKILLQKLHLIQISGVTRTKPEHIIKKKKIMT